MKNGREFVRENAKDKKVLNLFSYTCAFSLAAKMSGAYEVVNVDMSKGPYDMIIIDPPSFQKGSFEATKDYEKIIKKLEEIASEDCMLLSCLNSPNLKSDFIINLMKEWAPSFHYKKQLKNLEKFASVDEAKSLKNLVFQRVID